MGYKYKKIKNKYYVLKNVNIKIIATQNLIIWCYEDNKKKYIGGPFKKYYFLFHIFYNQFGIMLQGCKTSEAIGLTLSPVSTAFCDRHPSWGFNRRLQWENQNDKELSLTKIINGLNPK